jgi:hypothetical protein
MTNLEKLQANLNKLQLEIDNTTKYVGKALELFPNILPSLICGDTSEPFLSYKIDDVKDITDLHQLIENIKIDTSLSILKHGDNSIPVTVTLHDNGYDWQLKYTTISLDGTPIRLHVKLPTPTFNRDSVVSFTTINTTEGEKKCLTNLHHVCYFGGRIVYYADLYDQDELLDTIYKLYKYTQKGELNA